MDARKNKAFIEWKQLLKARTTLSFANEMRVSEAIPFFSASLLVEMQRKIFCNLFDLNAASSSNTLDECSKIFFRRGEDHPCGILLCLLVYCHMKNGPYPVEMAFPLWVVICSSDNSLCK